MPLSIADLAARKKAITFTWPDPEGVEQEVQMVYNPGWLTGEREKDIATWDSGTIAERNANWLSAMLVSWDVLDDKGKPYPTDYDSLFRLDRTFVAKATVTVHQDLYPNPRSAETSDATS